MTAAFSTMDKPIASRKRNRELESINSMSSKGILKGHQGRLTVRTARIDVQIKSRIDCLIVFVFVSCPRRVFVFLVLNGYLIYFRPHGIKL